MIRSHRLLAACLIGAALVGSVSVPRPAMGASAAEIDRDSVAALKRLYELQPAARTLAQSATAVLVFPRMIKAGFLFGGQMGEGSMRKGNLLKGGKPAGYYNSVAASYGLQAGIQEFGYALFFMNAAALASLDSRDGFEVGVGPSVVLVDQGMGKSITSSTLTQDIYAFIFSQKGLMAGMGIQGSKITKIDK
jgi:lipid-binding SYLF domain-containing protein